MNKQSSMRDLTYEKFIDPVDRNTDLDRALINSGKNAKIKTQILQNLLIETFTKA